MSNNLEKQEDYDDKELNSHMPQYIVKPPWYLNQTENSLNHQKSRTEFTKLPITIFTEKGINDKSKIYKYRKGACENCGSMTHKLKECCERPRKVGAKYSGKDFKADEFIYEVPLDYEGKRDRWNGYDPDSYKKLVFEYERFQEIRKKVKEEQAAEVNDDRLKRRLLRDDDLDENISSEDENRFMNLDYHEDFTEEEINEYIEALKNDPRNSKVDFDKISKEDLYKFATSKSLNISADYSKYLIKLGLSSAYYDPKSRSMRENPNPEDLTGFKGDNHARLSGDTQKLNEVENFINRANVLNKELNLNLVAGPTQAELYHRYHTTEKDKFTSGMKKKLIEKYGGDEYLKVPENITENDEYVEYTQTGEITETITNTEKKSKYIEDIYSNGHTMVWGSYYHEYFGWGYKCCLSFDKNSAHSIEAKKENIIIIDNYDKKKKEDLERERIKNEKKYAEMYKRDEHERKEGIFSDMFERMNTYENGGMKAVKERLTNKKRERNLDKAVKDEIKRTDRDSKNFNKKGFVMSKEEISVTEDDMEAYKLMKMHFDDPMRNINKL